jgi:hypothetical protein
MFVIFWLKYKKITNMYFSLPLQLAGFSTVRIYFLYIYIYIYRERERERARELSGLLFTMIGFVPDTTSWKIHEQIIEGDMSTEDQRNEQEAEKKTSYLRDFLITCSSTRQQVLG